MPNGRGVDDQVSGPDRLGQRFLPGRDHRPRPAGQCRGRGGSFGGPVEDRHLTCAGIGQGQHHGPGGPTGTDHQAPPAGRREASAPGQRRHETLPVGVGAEQHAFRVHDAVHGVEPPRHLGAFVDQAGHVRLVGHGDREAADVGSAHGGKRLRRLTGRDLEGHRAPRRAQSQRGERRVVQQRRQRVRDRAADDPHQPHLGTGVGPRALHRRSSRAGPRSHQGRPRLLASCSLASCSA